ncbi:MAG: sulfatase-like hydrolase/transferase [Nitrospiraceae bacterium]|nr:sulfatase-like hydrolase/transferase [Nitrospiraceae bacterium]
MFRSILRSAVHTVLAAACTAGFCSTGIAASAPAPTAPALRHEEMNVIVISLQCLRQDHLGTYGYQRDTSRNIDALASRSVLFENAIAQANFTPVAQMSIFTSQYARMHGMVSFEISKDTVTQRTLPEILKYYGYATAAFASSPEFFVRFDTSSGATINTADVYARSFDAFESTRRGLGPKHVRKIPDESLEWIRENKDRKFFLWIASGLLHMPYAAAVPVEEQTRYDDRSYTPFWKRLTQLPAEVAADEDPSYDVLSRVSRGDFYWGFQPVHHLSPADVQYVINRYDAGVHYTDQFIGELMRLLDSLHLTEKTLIVLHSSHGDDLGERSDFFHYDVSDGVVRDALIIRFPLGEFGGKRIAPQVQSIDIMPTVLEYLQVPVPHEAQGKSLLPLIRGDKGASGSEYAFIDRIPWWEYTLSKWYLEFQGNRGAHFAASEQARLKEYRDLLRQEFDRLDYPPGDIAVRTKEWKLVLRKNPSLLNRVSWWNFITGTAHAVDETALYDLAKDPQETMNVAAKHPEVVNRLKEKLLAWDRSMESRKTVFRKFDKRLIIPYP